MLCDRGGVSSVVYRFVRVLAVVFVLVAWSAHTTPLIAMGAAKSGKSSSSSTSRSGKTVHGKGYTKKNRTHAAPHYRKPPSAKTSASRTRKRTRGATTRSSASARPARVPTTTASTGAHPSTYCQKCARDSKGRILRGESAKHAFEAMTGYPHGRPGYVIDHIVPLACGGADNTSNMQWQTVAAGKLKDKTERVGCDD